MAGQAQLEPMNASPHHAKVKVSLQLADSMYVAGNAITGKVQLECKADKGLGIGVVMVELYAVEELTSRDHSATSTFLHTRRFFQGPGLPPSNAVQPHPLPGDPPVPTHYHTARRGITTFLFRLPLPASSPSAIDFGSGLAQVRYEVRATVGVAWKGENRLVFDKKPIDVVETFEEDLRGGDPEAVVVGENGRIWVQGRVIGGFMIAGQPGCVELQVKNHSSKKNSGLSVALTRELYLPNQPSGSTQPLQINDTLTSVTFRGPEYIIHPGAEGVATLVFDLPLHARGVRGGRRQGDEEGRRTAEALFEVRCHVNVKLSMGIGSKDIILTVPVTILHPSAIPLLPDRDLYSQPYEVAAVYDPSPGAIHSPPPLSPPPILERPLSPYAYAPPPPMSPTLLPYVDHGQVWLPPPIPAHSAYDAIYSPPVSPPLSHHYYYYPQPHSLPVPYIPQARPSSTEPVPSQPLYSAPVSPLTSTQQPLLPMPMTSNSAAVREEGKGERASRIASHLRMSSRHRSVSPPAHRYALPTAPEAHAPVAPPPASSSIPVPAQAPADLSPSSSPLTQRRLPTLNLSVSPARSQGSVVSPRPMLSPKHSFSLDPSMQVTQVEQLERIAALADSENPGMSASGASPRADAGMMDKTLPRVPDVEKGTFRAAAPRVDTLFPESAARPEETPPTPTLAAVTSLKVPRALDAEAGGGGLSGLDALEAKLLAQVGTRKIEKATRPDVRTVLPIAIPRPTEGDPANDSAISSLTLPGLDSDAKTLKVGQPNPGTELEPDADDQDDDRALTERWRDRESKENKKASSIGTRKSKDKDKERHGGPKSGEGKVKDEELQKLRKTAQGRVAAWLGSIEPAVPPPSGTPPPANPDAPVGLADLAREDSHGRVAAWLGRMQAEKPDDATPPHPPAGMPAPAADPASPPTPSVPSSDAPQEPRPNVGEEDVTAAPNPRSSGFVPISTLRPEAPHRAAAAAARPTDPSQGGDAKTPVVPPRLLALPARPVDPQVRYDIRSARGGRGGKVTAVAAIWASATQQRDSHPEPKAKPVPPQRENGVPARADVAPVSVPGASSASAKPIARLVHLPTPKPPKAAPPPPRPRPTACDARPSPAADLAARRARMIKSTSVPAMISSSHATPMLSSTASLARAPPVLAERNKTNARLAPIASEDPPPAGKTEPAKAPSPRAELAFGQARLRELIKRYQGQGST